MSVPIPGGAPGEQDGGQCPANVHYVHEGRSNESNMKGIRSTAVLADGAFLLVARRDERRPLLRVHLNVALVGQAIGWAMATGMLVAVGERSRSTQCDRKSRFFYRTGFFRAPSLTYWVCVVRGVELGGGVKVGVRGEGHPTNKAYPVR